MKKTKALESLRSPPPPAEPCLTRDRVSSQKGGTLINESVMDLSTHERWMLDPDRYRPPECKKCHHDVVHMHDRKDRVLRGDPAGVVVTIAIYLCVGCGATWRILPRFLARHLWRSWDVVEVQSTAQGARSMWPKVAARTRRRWLWRLRSSAAHLIQLFATSGHAALEAVAGSCGLEATRKAFVATYLNVIGGGSKAFADLAALIQRLWPGFRLM